MATWSGARLPEAGAWLGGGSCRRVLTIFGLQFLAQRGGGFLQLFYLVAGSAFHALNFVFVSALDGVQLFAQRHPTWGLLKLDIANAFGACSRAAALRELEAAGAGPLADFLRRLLSAPSRFAYDFFDEDGAAAREWIDAAEGADQGDPAGPVLFCAAFAPVLRALQARLGALVGPEFFLGAYMAALVLIVPPGSAGQALGVAL